MINIYRPLRSIARNLYQRTAIIQQRFLKIYNITFEKPVFIWGVGRSGTHLIYDILSLHPSMNCLKVESRWKKGLWGAMNWGDSTTEQLKGYRIPVEGIAHF